MKTFTFPAWCEFGKGDYGETWVDVTLTDEESERLLKFGTQSDNYYGGFSQCEEIQDIYDKVYTIAVDQITEELREGGDWVDEDDANNPDWRADHIFSCGVKFPQKFETMLTDEE
jgi:hypothetical protein